MIFLCIFFMISWWVFLTINFYSTCLFKFLGVWMRGRILCVLLWTLFVPKQNRALLRLGELFRLGALFKLGVLLPCLGKDYMRLQPLIWSESLNSAVNAKLTIANDRIKKKKKKNIYITFIYWFVMMDIPHLITSLIITKNGRDIETCRLAVHMSTIIMNQYINVTFIPHLSLCSSMVRASFRQSEGYGFDFRQGLRKFFCTIVWARIKKIIHLPSYHI